MQRHDYVIRQYYCDLHPDHSLQQFRYLCKRLKKKTKTKKTDQEKKAEKESEIVNPFSWTT